jgi:hypothetical protein
MSTEMIREMENQLRCGNVAVWEKGYYTFLRRSVLQEHQERFPQFEYDYSRRVVLYAWVQANILGEDPMDFLEFGVFQGESFLRWLALNRHPESRFFGCDTFSGLPELWEAGRSDKGTFDAQGKLPPTNDPRANFIPGLFQETLPAFAAGFQPHGRMVLHLDADLYSSTLFVLMTMNRHIRPGTVLVFDEFIAEDEFAAFHHFCKACMRSWRILAGRRDLHKVALEITA